MQPLPVSEFIIMLFDTTFLCESFTPFERPVVPLNDEERRENEGLRRKGNELVEAYLE